VTVNREPYVTARDVAEHLGFSPGWVQDHFEAGKLPGYKIGGKLRFKMSEIEAHMQGLRQGPAASSRRLREVVG
jgi:excisionase family DNA binding protein